MTASALALITAAGQPAAGAGPASAAASRPSVAGTTAAADAAPNAADIYRRAFAALPTMADRAAFDEIDDGRPLDAATLALAAKYDPVAALLRQAARTPRCAWGLDRTQGPAPVVPFLGPVGVTLRLVTLRVRAHVQTGRPGDALDECGAVLVLGRRVGAEPFLACKLFEVGSAKGMAEAAARALPAAPPEAVRRFEQGLAAMPASLTAAQAYEGDAAILLDWIARPENADPDRLFDPRGPLAHPVDDGREKEAAAAVKRAWADPETRRRELAQMREVAAAGTAVLAAKPADVPAATAAWARALEAGGPVTRDLATVRPAVVRQYADAADARFAVLRTAVAIRLNGPAALAASRDPAGDGPFVREDLPGGGYLLRSKQPGRDGAPVTLRVGP